MSDALLAPASEKNATGELRAPPEVAVSVIVPAYNEERTIDELLRRLLAVAGDDWEILIVNDGSTDGTAKILDKWGEPSGVSRRVPPVRVLHHTANQGKGAAVRTALAHATGEVVVIQDADLEYDPADLTRLIAEFADPNVQAVYGVRYGHAPSPQRQQGRWSPFRLAVSILNALVWLLYGRRLRDEATCYKLLRRALMNSLELRSTGFELCAEITAKLCARGVPILERPISYQPRGYGEGKKIGIGAFFRCVRELVRCRFAGVQTYLPSRRVWLAVVFIGVLGGLALARSGWLQNTRPRRPLVDAGLYVSPHDLDFGEAYESAHLDWRMQFHNTSDEVIRINGFDYSCHCLTLMPEQFEIPAGQFREVVVTLDLSQQRSVAELVDAWHTRTWVRAQWITGSGRRGRSIWQISGRVKPIIRIHPNFVWLGDDIVRGSYGRKRTAQITSLAEIGRIALADQPAGLTCELSRNSVGYHLSVTTSSQLTSGSLSRNLKLNIFDKHSRPLPTQTIAIIGQVVEKVAIVPEAVHFGVCAIGAVQEETIVITSRVGKSLQQPDVEIPPEMTVSIRDAGNGVWLVRLRQPITKAGNGRSIVRTKLFCAGEEIQIPIAVTWFGSMSAGGPS